MSLDGVISVDTALSQVDGEMGRLIVCGLTLDQLVLQHSFTSTLERIWKTAQHTSFASVEVPLSQARATVFPTVAKIVPHTSELEPIEALRACLDLLPNPVDDLELVAMMPVALAAHHRVRAKLAPIAPDPSLDHCEDFLRMMDLPIHSQAVQGLQTYLITVAEHGMNASSFTARVVASTRAGHRAAVSAALGALQGPLHGGAPGPVLDMLDLLEHHPDRAGWLEQQILDGQRLMGFGHRIYKVRDPRADILSNVCQQLPNATSKIQLAQEVETLARTALAKNKPGRSLDTNVEYYTALLLDGLGFRREEFTAVFACGRVLGWIAHATEQERTGRLIRPESRYTGVELIVR
jgi:citrate synthase